MRIRQHSLPWTLAAAVAMLASACDATAVGPSAMPSRVAQYFGYGYGPGHHAPIVRTPGHHPENVPRYARVPRSYGPLYPAPYAPLGCYGEACYPAPAPGMMMPEPTMAPAPLMAPEPIPASMPAVAPQPERQARRF